MSWSRHLGSLGAAFTLTFAGIAAARPPGCEEQCTPDASDSLLCTCWERAGAPVTTCGEYRENMCGLLLELPGEASFSQGVERTEASSSTAEELMSAEPQADVCLASR
ncbi:MAG: hypothetical protein JXB05_26475 [Myxococcaceae bacterium]|nr:hypothetical protein [Myxococcaceae bacterium]